VRERAVRIILGLLLSAFLTCIAGAEQSSPFPSDPKIQNLEPETKGQDYPLSVIGKCVFVTDGDTIKVKIGDEVKPQNVRLIGINAPERKDPGWRASRDYLSQLCFDKEVRLEFDHNKRDRYKRLLAYIFVEDETGKELFANGEMLSAEKALYYGYAATQRYDARLKTCIFDEDDPYMKRLARLKPLTNPREAQVTFFREFVCIDKMQRTTRDILINNMLERPQEDLFAVYDTMRQLAREMGIIQYLMEQVELPPINESGALKIVEDSWVIYYLGIKSLQETSRAVVANYEGKQYVNMFEVRGKFTDANQNIDLACNGLAAAAVMLGIEPDELRVGGDNISAEPALHAR